MKLVDIPDMNYFTSSDEPKGEIWFRGPLVFTKYFKNKEKTDEAIDADGWTHTGDVGQILPNGALKIIDRKKMLFKLVQGEYIAAEKLENIYINSPFITQIMVYGDSLQAYLIAIAVPDEVYLKKWASENKIEDSDNASTLCEKHDVK
jgi:long-chain acyl-CoA synthetase